MPQTEQDKYAEEDKRETKRYIKIAVISFVTFVSCIMFFFVMLRFGEIARVFKSLIKCAEPIIFGLVLAYLLNPVMKFVEKPCLKYLTKHMKSQKKARKLSRVAGVFASILFLFAVIGLLGAAIIPSVVDSVMGLVEIIPSSVEKFVDFVQNEEIGEGAWAATVSDAITNGVSYLGTWIQESLLPKAQTYITQITSGVISAVKSILNFAIGIFVAVYCMSIQETLVGQSKKIVYAVFKPHVGNLIIEVSRKTNEIFGGFITGKILDSAIIGVICYIGCCILQMPDAMLIAVIVGATNVIPFFGPIIGAIPCVLLVLIQSPIQAVYLAIFILILQQVDGNIIGPKILGDSTGLSSFWVMFAILVAGGMFGFFGMLLGVPAFATIYYGIRRLVNYFIRKKQLPVSTESYIQMIRVEEEDNCLVYFEEDKKKESSEEIKEDKK